MDTIQQLFMVAFVAFVFSILLEKLAFVTNNGEERKSKRTKVNYTQSKSKSKINKKVRFAVQDQIAIVINNKLVKLGAIKRFPTKKQMFTPTIDDLNKSYLGAIWIGEEFGEVLMTYKEDGLDMELHQLDFDCIQDQREIPYDEAQTLFRIDDETEDGDNENTARDYIVRKLID